MQYFDFVNNRRSTILPSWNTVKEEHGSLDALRRDMRYQKKSLTIEYTHALPDAIAGGVLRPGSLELEIAETRCCRVAHGSANSFRS